MIIVEEVEDLIDSSLNDFMITRDSLSPKREVMPSRNSSKSTSRPRPSRSAIMLKIVGFLLSNPRLLSLFHLSNAPMDYSMNSGKEQKQQMDTGRISFKVQSITQFPNVFSMLFGCVLSPLSSCRKEKRLYFEFEFDEFSYFRQGFILLINNLIQASKCTLVEDNKNRWSSKGIRIT